MFVRQTQIGSAHREIATDAMLDVTNATAESPADYAEFTQANDMSRANTRALLARLKATR